MLSLVSSLFNSQPQDNTLSSPAPSQKKFAEIPPENACATAYKVLVLVSALILALSFYTLLSTGIADPSFSGVKAFTETAGAFFGTDGMTFSTLIFSFSTATCVGSAIGWFISIKRPSSPKIETQEDPTPTVTQAPPASAATADPAIERRATRRQQQASAKAAHKQDPTPPSPPRTPSTLPNASASLSVSPLTPPDPSTLKTPPLKAGAAALLSPSITYAPMPIPPSPGTPELTSTPSPTPTLSRPPSFASPSKKD